MPEIQTLLLVFSAGLLLAMTPGPDLNLADSLDDLFGQHGSRSYSVTGGRNR